MNGVLGSIIFFFQAENKSIGIVEILGLVISFFSLIFTIFVWVIGRRFSTEKEVEHNKKMREEFLKFDEDFRTGKIENGELQIRNSRMWKNPNNLFVNKYSFFKGKAKKRAYIEEVEAMGVWLSLWSDANNDETVELQNHKYFLSSYIPYNWVQAIDDENEEISQFVDNGIKKIIYIKAPYFMFPYKLQTILPISESIGESGAGKESVKINYTYLTKADWKRIKKQAQRNRSFYRFGIRKHRVVND